LERDPDRTYFDKGFGSDRPGAWPSLSTMHSLPVAALPFAANVVAGLVGLLHVCTKADTTVSSPQVCFVVSILGLRVAACRQAAPASLGLLALFRS
jgi:hypothetical protein